MASPIIEIGRRFLFSGKGSSAEEGGRGGGGFISFIAWISIVGVAVGVLALVVVTSVINGFEGELARVMTGMNGDVILFSREPVAEPSRVEKKIRAVLPEVQAMTASFISEVMVAGELGVSGALVEGFDSTTHAQVSDVSRHVVEGEIPQLNVNPERVDEDWVRLKGKVALGAYLAEKIGAKIGDEIRIVIPGVENSTEANSPSTAKVYPLRVSGIIRLGLFEYDSKFIYMPLEVSRVIFGLTDQVSSFKLRLPKGADENEAARKLAENFGFPFKARSWSQLNRNLLYAIELEKVVIALILIVIIIVAAFNVVSTLMMMIHDKTKEIAILKAMGLRPHQGFWLFCSIGLLMGIIGTIMGVSFGLGLNWLLGHTRLIKLPPEIYYINFLPVVTEWREVIGIGLFAILISFLATLYPAIKVSTRPPLEGLRYE